MRRELFVPTNHLLSRLASQVEIKKLKMLIRTKKSSLKQDYSRDACNARFGLSVAFTLDNSAQKALREWDFSHTANLKDMLL